MNPTSPGVSYTASHWGLYEVTGRMTAKPIIRPYSGDPDPSPIGTFLNDPAVEELRVARPAIRKGWLERRAGRQDSGRGGDEYVEVEWQQALQLVASELSRVRDEYGNEAIFGGSYGWASAGRFHHAQSQIHRFLNCFGGYVAHRDSYSLGAARVLMPWLVAPMDQLMSEHTDWQTLADHCELFVTFGGVPLKNAQISVGGTAEHRVRAGLRTMHDAGVGFINISPVEDDIDTGGEVDWWAIRPNTDAALLLALAHTIRAHKLENKAFLQTCSVGYETFGRYLDGADDGIVKSASWAADITGIAAEDIESLALKMVRHRTMINMAWSLQRAHHGEQPYWALVSLAAMLGQIGLPGGGFAVCYGAENLMGSARRKIFGPTFPQGKNPLDRFIPVARIADMLLQPGTSFSYNGGHYQYPDLRLIYWAGGNPFHHHQDLNRLQQAWQLPETIITHEQYWTAAAKMADIVLPATTTLEREDIFYAAREPVIAAMKQVQPAFGEARDDFAIFAELASLLDIDEAFTEGRDARGWLRYLYDDWQQKLVSREGIELPDFDMFWESNLVEIPQQQQQVVMLESFRRDPVANPLATPSGKIEIFSESIAAFGLADCPGHACWIEPHEWLGSDKAADYPLHLISDQPRNKLHSQLDHSPHSRADKIDGREPVYLSPFEAVKRGLNDGDLVEVFNDRGSCLAAVVVSERIRDGVVRLSTGAWLDPLQWRSKSVDQSLEKHGNPNVLTADIPASMFSQGCTAHSCLVDVRRWQTEPPAVSAFDLPMFNRPVQSDSNPDSDPSC